MEWCYLCSHLPISINLSYKLHYRHAQISMSKVNPDPVSSLQTASSSVAESGSSPFTGCVSSLVLDIHPPAREN